MPPKKALESSTQGYECLKCIESNQKAIGPPPTSPGFGKGAVLSLTS